MTNLITEAREIASDMLGADYERAETRAIDIIPKLCDALEKYRWIPVTERLPEDAALVLIYPVDDEAASAQYWQQSNHFRMWDYCVKPGDVTHWMPLPAAPEEGAEHE